MPIQYPRTCTACGGTYSVGTNYYRHLRKGHCERKQATPPVVNNVSNVTINNHLIKSDAEIKTLQEQNKQLQLQVEAFKAQANNVKLPLVDEVDEYIYVIQERIAMELLIPVYKVGVTAEIHRRSGQYAKGSRLIFCRVFRNARDREKALHKHLQSKFKPRSDFGSEYIEGCIDDIMDEIQLYFNPSDGNVET